MQDKYKYTDVSERNRRMNRFYIVATSLLGLMFLFYLWMKQFNHNIPSVVVYCNTALIAVFAAVNVIVYRKNTATRYLKVMSTIEIGDRISVNWCADRCKLYQLCYSWNIYTSDSLL